ncbi:MAG: nitrous oxide reductase accessory protein NosL [Deltaproteobacteria bacterium]
MHAPHVQSRRQFLGVLGRGALDAAVFACATACGSEHDEVAAQRSTAASRCALCGMRVTRGAAFSSGAREASGSEVLFDSVKCMFRWLGQHPEAREPWVTEHLSRSTRPARDVVYVVGTDLEGPMGADLVPVDTREHAEQIRVGHHGTRVLGFAEITPEVLDELFRM